MQRFFLAPMHRLATALALFASLLIPVVAPAQFEGFGFRIYKVESGLYPFVQVYFRTFDQNLRPLVNLNELNVGVMVRGRAYDPTKFQYMVQSIQNRQEAVRSVLVIDCSKTMEGEPFAEALRAAARYVDSKRPQDQIAILAIVDNERGYERVSPFERDPAALARRLADMKADGLKSRIYDSVAAAMQMCATTSQGGATTAEAEYIISNSIVLISDGNDEGSSLSREELNNRITNLRVPVPVFSLGYTQVNPVHLSNLESLSLNSFGQYFPVGADTKELQRVVEDIQRNILMNDYVLTFRSYIPVDGQEHRLKLAIEYPKGSGKITYQGAEFEALMPPPLKPVVDAMTALDGKLKQLPNADPSLPPGPLVKFLPKDSSAREDKK